ncbi:MAG: hypothetical protein LCH46_14220 [Proteobacteria bacterium]|nr:hypothetical protein [Pseudomonadota bacterium]
MRKYTVLAATVCAVFAGTAPVRAAEVLIANIAPGTTEWFIDGAPFMSVPTGQHGIKKLAAGSRSVEVLDYAGGKAGKQVNFDPAQTAQVGGREFWCLASRPAAAGGPELLVLEREICLQFLGNQPPGN